MFTVSSTFMWAILTGQTDWVCHIGTLTLCIEAVAWSCIIVTWWSGSGGIQTWSRWPTVFLWCFDTVGLVIWPVKIVPEMTCNVLSGTLSLYTTATSMTSSSFIASTRLQSSDGDNLHICTLQNCEKAMGMIWALCNHEFFQQVIKMQNNEEKIATDRQSWWCKHTSARPSLAHWCFFHQAARQDQSIEAYHITASCGSRTST